MIAPEPPPYRYVFEIGDLTFALSNEGYNPDFTREVALDVVGGLLGWLEVKPGQGFWLRTIRLWEEKPGEVYGVAGFMEPRPNVVI